MSAASALAAFVALLALPCRGELLPLPPLPADRTLQLTFEILPAEPGARLPEELRTFEGGRLSLEEAWARGERYRKATVVFPLPSGDTRERVYYYAESGDHLRLIGFHRILRHLGMPEGETIVFNPGPDVPMQGRGLSVPEDTYTFLGLFTALGGIAATGRALEAHLWVEDAGTVPVGIRPDGGETLDILATKIESLRLRVEPREPGASPVATIWLTAGPPHTFLQYRGPADFLISRSEPAVLLRATSSSEQVRRAFESLVPGPDPD